MARRTKSYAQIHEQAKRLTKLERERSGNTGMPNAREELISRIKRKYYNNIWNSQQLKADVDVYNKASDKAWNTRLSEATRNKNRTIANAIADRIVNTQLDKSVYMEGDKPTSQNQAAQTQQIATANQKAKGLLAG